MSTEICKKGDMSTVNRGFEYGDLLKGDLSTEICYNGDVSTEIMGLLYEYRDLDVSTEIC